MIIATGLTNCGADNAELLEAICSALNQPPGTAAPS